MNVYDNEKLNTILTWLTNYKEKTSCRGIVIGLSGGKDSTTVAMLAKEVWGDDVFAVLMPNGVQRDIADSIAIAEALKIKYRIVNIGDAYNALLNSIEYTEAMDSNGLPEGTKDLSITDKARTNISPRLRMTVLYAIAQTLGYRVIGTGNRSEAYVGWCTKWGDCAHDLNPIAHLTCTEVVEIGKILAKEFCLDEKYITKTPTDGLTGKSDEENLGFTYEELDKFLLSGELSPDDVVDRICLMHKQSEHKRHMPQTIREYYPR